MDVIINAGNMKGSLSKVVGFLEEYADSLVVDESLDFVLVAPVGQQVEQDGAGLPGRCLEVVTTSLRHCLVSFSYDRRIERQFENVFVVGSLTNPGLYQ